MDRDEQIRSQTRYVSIRSVYEQVQSEANNVGETVFLNRPSHQKWREKWLAVGYGSLFQKMMKRQLFLRFPPPEQEPPDFIAIYKENEADRQYAELLVEITELDPFSFRTSGLSANDALIDRIQKKIDSSNKGDYPEKMGLLVYCNISARISLEKVRKRLREVQPPFGQIWLLGANDKAIAKVSMWELWPGKQGEEVKIDEWSTSL